MGEKQKKPPAVDCPRTTNGAESFHADYNKQFYSRRPNIHFVIKALEEIQAETLLKIKSIQKGSVNPLCKSHMEEIKFLVEAWEEYQTDGNAVRYIGRTGQKTAVN